MPSIVRFLFLTNKEPTSSTKRTNPVLTGSWCHRFTWHNNKVLRLPYVRLLPPRPPLRGASRWAHCRLPYGPTKSFVTLAAFLAQPIPPTPFLVEDLAFSNVFNAIECKECNGFAARSGQPITLLSTNPLRPKWPLRRSATAFESLRSLGRMVGNRSSP